MTDIKEKKANYLVRILGPLFIIIFTLLCMFFAIEVYIRIGFDTLPAGVQGDIQAVRRVPWSEERIIRPIPFLADRNYQARLEPNLQDFPVRWKDARFRFTTRELWEGHPVGLRTDEIRWPLDLAAFGDSFTFCWTDVEDCWVQKLQNDYGYSVLNAGQPGTGSGGQLQLMKEILEPIQAPLVIWQWYGNDLQDDYVLATFRGETTELPGPPGPIPAVEPKGFERYSALYFMLQLYILNPPQVQKPYLEYIDVEIQGRKVSFATDEYTHSFSLSWPSVAYGWERHVQHHEEAAALVDELGAELLLVLIPTKEEAFQAYLDDYRPEFFEEAAEGRKAMIALCEERKWHCIDMLPIFQEAIHDGETVYYAGDFHLNASGNAIVAQVVHDYIVEHNLIHQP
ncbi:MAG: hypothetical protein CUN55_13270 [Phototrophicales bacterium]|nr:MAG: hypothetical protein CUN55_13270 [Phototrophicales bacterium]